MQGSQVGDKINTVLILSNLLFLYFISVFRVDPPPSHKPAPPPKKKTEVKTHITAQDIQVYRFINKPR